MYDKIAVIFADRGRVFEMISEVVKNFQTDLSIRQKRHTSRCTCVIFLLVRKGYARKLKPTISVAVANRMNLLQMISVYFIVQFFGKSHQLLNSSMSAIISSSFLNTRP